MHFYVKDIMTTDLVTIKQDDTIRTLIKTMSDEDVLGVPVVDSDDYIVGVVSAEDILKNESSKNFYYQYAGKKLDLKNFKEDFFDQNVETIMSTDLFTVDPDESINVMAKIMYDKRIHRLLVVQYNKLLGIVTTFDLLKLIASSDTQVIV